MYKSRHSPTSPSFVPGTPKLSNLSLPEEPRAGPSRPAISADIRQPQNTAKPLKSILKKSGNAQVHDSCDSDGEIPAAKWAAGSRCNVPGKVSPEPHLAIMMFDLHWQLLPFDPRRSKQFLHFDVALPVENIVFQGHDYPTKLSATQLDKPAANSTLTKMIITFESKPFSWDVDVKNARGITCRDVFEAIYNAFNKQLTLEERRLILDSNAVKDAFQHRCKRAPGLTQVEGKLGVKRVDVLCRQTIFRGLTQPESSSDWVLNLGTLPHIRNMP